MRAVDLATERFVLTAPEAADVDAVFAACQDPEIQRWTTVPAPYERHHAEEFCTGADDRWRTGVEQTWAIREGTALLGVVGLNRTSADSAELGYWIAPAARGRGVLVEAAWAALDWGLDPAGGAYARIGWRAAVGNLASARAARALGFHFEGMSRMALPSHRGREDAWLAGLLPGDDRSPQPWPILEPSATAS